MAATIAVRGWKEFPLFLTGFFFLISLGPWGCGSGEAPEMPDEGIQECTGNNGCQEDVDNIFCTSPLVCSSTQACLEFLSQCENVQNLLEVTDTLVCAETRCVIVKVPSSTDQCITGPPPPIRCLDGIPQDPGECVDDLGCVDFFGPGFGICISNCCEPYSSHGDNMDADHDGFNETVGVDNCFNPNNYNPGQEDCDTDGKGDACDNCPEIYNPVQEDCDFDGAGNECDEDDDNDGMTDDVDSCPIFPNLNSDLDSDGMDDVCDNCPSDSNSDQADSDAIVSPSDPACGVPFTDLVGDACDNCPTVINFDQLDTDGDGTGNACEADDDDDGLDDEADNCPTVASLDQTDSEGDGVGDLCDNCVSVINPEQFDCDSNGVGDACDEPCGGPGHGGGR